MGENKKAVQTWDVQPRKSYYLGKYKYKWHGRGLHYIICSVVRG